MEIDSSTEYGTRVEKHLREDMVVWLTTVRPNGQPEPSPVWFLWDGQTILMYSQVDRQKLHNIASNPHVSLNFNCTPSGLDVVAIAGEAHVEASTQHAGAYLDKYRESIKAIGMTPESFTRSFSVPVRITPSKVRGR